MTIYELTAGLIALLFAAIVICFLLFGCALFYAKLCFLLGIQTAWANKIIKNWESMD